MPYPRIYAFADESGAMIDHQIEAMRRNGLQGLEIRNVDGENISAISLDKAREVRRKLDDAGLVTWSIGSPLGKIDIEKDDFQAHLDALRHTLDLAQILGAANIRMFSDMTPVTAGLDRFPVHQLPDSLFEALFGIGPVIAQGVRVLRVGVHEVRNPVFIRLENVNIFCPGVALYSTDRIVIPVVFLVPLPGFQVVGNPVCFQP